MASKEIHICDWCKSYMEVPDVYEISIDFYPDIGGIVDRDRQICSKCRDIIIDTLQLDKDSEELNDAAFEGFKLK